MDFIIRPILPNPRDYPGNIIPLIDSAIFKVLTGPVKIRARNAMADRVRNWKKPPVMGTRYSRPSVDIFQIRVWPTGSAHVVSKWIWVSQGTEPHPISAVFAPTLRFKEKYEPHTKPGNKYGISGGGTYSGAWQTPTHVQNPGIEAREFEKHVVEEIKNDIINDIEKAIRLAVG